MAAVHQRRYDRLIAGAKARSTVGAYFELHHIVPRSLGGTDSPENVVALTAREHFVAHWLLYRIHRSPATARAFKLMVNDQGLRRGRDYADARKLMADAMRGEANVSKRPEVRAKLKANCYSPFAGKKRPEHAALMREKGLMAKENNPFFGRGAEQAGALNHMARKVAGVHPWFGVALWDTASAAAQQIGVSLQAVAQAVRKKGRSKGWRLEYIK